MKKYTLYHVSEATLFEADGNGTLPGQQFYACDEADAELAAKRDTINAAAEGIAQRDARIAELERAIRWALGEGDSDFGDHLPDDLRKAPPFWWRTELRKRAGF